MRWFESRLSLNDDAKVLDVGGTAVNWEYSQRRPDVLMLNRMVPPIDTPLPDNLSYDQGDALAMPYDDGQFDVGFSNSVIEHMGTWENQQRFADEIRRVAGALWVQTPAREFPVEPHFVAPLIHWLPKSWRKRVARFGTLWGWVERPTAERVEEIVEEIRLLSYREMRRLFPDCEILVERVLFWPKSYIALRCPAVGQRAERKNAAAAASAEQPLVK